MQRIILATAAVLAVVTVPFWTLNWILESQPERIRRLHASGLSQRAVARQLGLSRYRVRLTLAA